MVSFHADDFALAVSSSKDIISLCQLGKVDALSVISNISCFDECMELYKAALASFPHKVTLSVHLNVMEGRPVSDVGLVKNLVDEGGLFKVSWASLFMDSFNPFRRGKVRRQLALELEAQVKRCLATGLFDKNAICLDSHQHPHHIPVFFDAMLDTVRRLQAEGCTVTYIRNSEDPLSPYLSTPSVYPHIKIANVIKCIVLNILSFRVKRHIKKMGIVPTYLSGVFFSGSMFEENLRHVLPKLFSLAQKKDRPLELLFHPGRVTVQEIDSRDEYQKQGFVDFSTSSDRSSEYQSVSSIKDELKKG